MPIALFSPADTEALTLGRMTVLSPLGKRFEAEVPLLGGDADKGQIAECFRLGEGSEPDIPALTSGRVRVLERGGRLLLQVVSGQTINEPLLQVNLRMGCGVEVARNYVLLIDPTRTRSTPPAVQLPVVRPISEPRSAPPELGSKKPSSRQWRVGRSQSARDIARAAFPQKPRAQARFIRELQAINPETDLGARGTKRLAPGTVLNLPAGRLGPRTVVSAAAERNSQAPTQSEKRPPPRKATPEGGRTDRLIISSGTSETSPGEDASARADDGELLLRPANRLSTPRIGKATDEQRARLRLEYELLSALREQAEQQLALAEKVRRLEAAISELEKKAAEQARPAASAPATAAPAVSPASKPSASSPGEARPVTPASETNDWWFGIAALLGLTAGLAWWLRRRASQRATDAAGTGPASPLLAAGSRPAKSDAGWQLHKLNRGDASLLAAESVAAPPSQAPASASPARPPASGDDDDVTAVLELAEIMVSFGRVTGAAQALKEFVDHKPFAAVTPWLKLLEAYRQSGQREAFDLAGMKLKLHFNVAPADWESASEAAGPVLSLGAGHAAPVDEILARLPAIRQLPHIAREISRTWDSTECLDYLNKLLRDNRGGERRGFTLSAVRELLFLIDLQENRLAGRS
ncbi:hypothetical protein [Accumulibacter sp.]|uniref:type IV pilus assembly protein FimV n=1 Tax=Accumulibacter sp. TaxID=2053492 RepID=UPI002605EE1E|nr:hypothetical protein [Accumulibacter sp.]